MIERENIPMPTEAERKQAIRAILDAGELPEKGLWKSLAAARSLPFSMLFFGMGDCLFLALLFAIGCILTASAAAVEQAAILPLLFLLSPALYAALHLLTKWKEFVSGTLEWKQTCRLSFRSLTALRMLLFGGAATLLCVPQSALIWYVSGRELSLLWMLSVSFASLFLYAVLSLALSRCQTWLSAAAAPVAWICMGILLLRWNQASAFLLRVPTAVFAVVAAAALTAMLYQIKSFIVHASEGRISYAVR